MATLPQTDPTAGQHQRPSYGYETLYENIALRPEVGRFRRFAGEWAKLLHDDTADVLTCQRAVHDALFKARGSEQGVTVFDCPRTFVKVYHKEIYDNVWKPYERALRKYGETLVMSQQIMKLPDQPAYATRFLARFGSPTFDHISGCFGLTQEQSKLYLGPPRYSDSCAWRGLPNGDKLTKGFIRISPWIEGHVLKHLRAFIPGKRRTEQRATTGIDHEVVVEIMDYLTCITVSLLLTGALFGLAHIQPLGARIAGIGAFGTLFSLFVKLVTGDASRRAEVFAATAAFFAVASVFVSNAGGGCSGR